MTNKLNPYLTALGILSLFIIGGLLTKSGMNNIGGILMFFSGYLFHWGVKTEFRGGSTNDK